MHRFSWLDKKKKKQQYTPSIKKDKKCVYYVVTVALHHEKINEHPERMPKIKPFIDRYNWKGINIHQKNMTGNILRKIILSMLQKYVTKNNSNCKKQVI